MIQISVEANLFRKSACLIGKVEKRVHKLSFPYQSLLAIIFLLAIGYQCVF